MHTHLAGASPQPHAHTTSYARHLQAQPMLAVPRSPRLAPAPGAASPSARYSPSATHSLSPMRCCSHTLAHPSRTPASPVEASDSLVPPPNTDTRPHARPDAHLPVRPDVPRRYRRRRARAGCPRRQSTQERCKAGWQEGRGAPINQCAKRKLPAHSSLTSSRFQAITTAQSHRFESNAETADSDALHLAAMLHHAGRRARGRGSGRRGQPW